jgi:hypothetical protein
MFTSATRVSPFRTAMAPTMAQSWRGAGTSGTRTRPADLGHADLGEQLVGLEGGLEEAPEELGDGDSPLATVTLDDERGVEREQECGKVRGRIPVRDGPTDRSPVAHLVVAYLGRHRAQRRAVGSKHVARLEIAVAGQRTHREVVVGVAHVGELAHASNIDEHRRGGEPQLHEREQRHTAGEDLGIVPVLGQRGDCLVGRACSHVVERRRDHWLVPAAASTARTMLW